MKKGFLKIRRRTGFFILSVLLAGCSFTPEKWGFSDIAWKEMSPSQQKTQQLACVTTQQTVRHNKVVTYDGPNILIILAKGSAMMPPFIQSYSFRMVSFKLKPGQCKSIKLVSLSSLHTVKLKACYNGLTLMLDPSRCDPERAWASVRFDFHPLWRTGLSYHEVSSSGYTRLHNTTVTIQAIK